MNKLTALAIALIALTPVAASANEHEKAAAPAVAADAAAAPAVAPAGEVKEVTLKDGTKAVIEGENVFTVAEDGAKTPAPDGEHELADGTKIKVAGGKLVKEEEKK
jgi:hypothetical protein